MKHKEIISFIFYALLSLSLAIIIANRSDEFKERNDTAVYSEHFQCVVDGDDGCKNLIGGLDYVYYPVADTLTLISFGDFYVFKLLLAFMISLPIILFVGTYSSNPFISLIFLLIDYRFYEYSGNVLRHGLALSIFCMICLLFKKISWRYYTGVLLAVLTHLSAFVLLFIPREKMSRLKLGLLFLITLLILGSSTFIFSSYSEILPAKLIYYIEHTENQGFSVPLHYFLVFSMTVMLYRRIDNDQVFIANIVIVLFLSALVMNSIGMGYRYISFLLPFTATILPYLYTLVCKKIKHDRQAVLSMIHFVVLVFFIILFGRYYDFILIHLS